MRPSLRAGWLTRPALALLGALAVAGLGGCGTISEKVSGPLSSMPGIGIPADTPARPAEAKPFPAVHDMPPPRANALLDGSQQQMFEKELNAAREEQKIASSPPPEPAAAPTPAKPAKPGAKTAAKPAAKPAAAKPGAKPVATPAAASTTTPAVPTVPVSSSRMIY